MPVVLLKSFKPFDFFHVANLFKSFKKRASLGREIMENSVKLLPLARHRGDRQVTAVIREDNGDAFARFDHALDEHHFARRHAHSPRHETAEQHLDRWRRDDSGWAGTGNTTSTPTCVRWYPRAGCDWARGIVRVSTRGRLEKVVRIGAHLFVKGYRLSGGDGGIIVPL